MTDRPKSDPTIRVNHETQPEGKGLPRRDLLKMGAAGLGLAALGGCTPGSEETAGKPRLQRPDLGAAPDQPFAAPPIDLVRIGYVGVGGMGTAHVRNLLRIEGCEITAVCDIVPEHAERSATLIEEAGFARPALYTQGETDFERLCAEEELDLVYTATPWEWHVPVVLAAMENGKHAATEVPAAYTLDDCWAMVEAAERTQKHCIMMENCNYGRMEMLCFNLVKQGIMGEIVHGAGGYLHDLRGIKFADSGEGLWRRAHSMDRNGNLYPTHGLGPVANCMDINRGDAFATLVSMSSPSKGLQNWARDNYPEGHPKRQETYVCGDVNTSIIQTQLGRTIIVGHDCNLPRPYDRINLVQGTNGIFQGYPHRVYIEGMSEQSHSWDEASDWLEEYDHPLWKEMAEQSAGAGHGGMDFMEDYRLIKCLREGIPTDMNVYDAAAISAVTPLSEWSVANGGAPVDFPDFTRGKWKNYPPWELFGA
ncbi:MAG: Gfo/Idh/MocA family oxidoreductase [Gemmatimonadetes bacterium]|nr:Gfo/Idh/MocA family oxidoreductase [Gemmatimonadota bacterium]